MKRAVVTASFILAVALCTLTTWYVAHAASSVTVAPRYAFMVREVTAEPLHHVIEQGITSIYADPKLAIRENQMTVYAEDHFTSDFPSAGAVAGIITIERAPVIHLSDGKKTTDIRGWDATIGDALSAHHVPEIGQDDKIDHKLDDKIVDNEQVTIVRVAKTTIVEHDTIAFQTIQKDDSAVFRGQTKVLQAGHDGVKTRTYEVTREDGVEVSRILQKTEITTPKEDRIVVNGSKLLIGRTARGNASWYRSAYTAASNMFKRGTDVRITSSVTSKSIEVRIDDFMEGTDKVIDLNPSVFTALGGTLAQGIQAVVVEEVLN